MIFRLSLSVRYICHAQDCMTAAGLMRIRCRGSIKANICIAFLRNCLQENTANFESGLVPVDMRCERESSADSHASINQLGVV